MKSFDYVSFIMLPLFYSFESDVTANDSSKNSFITSGVKIKNNISVPAIGGHKTKLGCTQELS